MSTQTLSAGELFSTEAFFDETVKIASFWKKRALKKSKKLVQDALKDHAPSAESVAQLKKMKLQKQLDAMKKAKGIAV